MVAGSLAARRLSSTGPCGGRRGNAVSIGEFFPAVRACFTIKALYAPAIQEAPGEARPSAPAPPHVACTTREMSGARPLACDGDRFRHSNTQDVTHTVLS